MNTENLIALGRNAESYFLNQKGYDNASFRKIMIDPDGEVSFYFDLYDDFQKDVPFEHRCKHETYMTISHEDILNLSSWPSREQRELSVLAARLGSIDHDISKITSDRARAFVEALTPSIEALRRQLT